MSFIRQVPSSLCVSSGSVSSQICFLSPSPCWWSIHSRRLSLCKWHSVRFLMLLSDLWPDDLTSLTGSLCSDRVNPPGPTSFSGHVIGESAMKKTEDVGSLLLFTLQVCLLIAVHRLETDQVLTHYLVWQVHIKGKPLGHLGNLQVVFDWPREVSNGKWLLYLTDIEINGTSESHCAPPGNIINPLNLMVTMTTSASYWLLSK